MNSTLVFRPRPSQGWLSLLVIALLVLVLLALPSFTTGGGLNLVFGLFGLVFGGFLLLLMSWFFSMRYELDDKILHVRCGPVIHYRIPVKEITAMRRKNLSISLWSSFRMPGLALFSVPYSDEGSVNMCATRAAEGILLIEVDHRKYGITPDDEAGLIAAIQERMRA